MLIVMKWWYDYGESDDVDDERCKWDDDDVRCVDDEKMMDIKVYVSDVKWCDDDDNVMASDINDWGDEEDDSKECTDLPHYHTTITNITTPSSLSPSPSSSYSHHYQHHSPARSSKYDSVQCVDMTKMS